VFPPLLPDDTSACPCKSEKLTFRTIPGEQLQHDVQLCNSKEFLIDVLSQRIGRALFDEPALAFATASHWPNAREIIDMLACGGALEESCFHLPIGDALRAMSSLAVRQLPGVFALGEIVALLWAQGRGHEAIRLERLWNDLTKKYPFSLLHRYPAFAFNNTNEVEPFLTMDGEQSHVMHGKPLEDCCGLRSGERLRAISHWERKAVPFERGISREAEGQFRLLVEAVEDYAIFMLDPRGYVRTWNIGAQRIKQYDASEIIGKHFSCFYPEEDVRRGKPEWELVMAEKQGRYEDEDWRMRKDGSKFWANVIITALRNRRGELVGFGKVTRDVTERMRAQRKLEAEVAERRDAERQLHASEKSLRELSLHLLRTQDEERRQIGRDLHDSLGQYLAVLKMKLDSLSETFGPSEKAVAQDLAQCVHLTEGCIKEVRTASYLLYPPMLEELGLTSAIPWYLDGFSSRSGIKTTFTAEAKFGRISRDSELALFRVLQEGLTNVHRHSQSETAYVRLTSADGFCTLEIADEGVGMPAQLLDQPGEEMITFGVGLRGMSERMRHLGGRLEIVPNDTGATLRAIVPTGEPWPTGFLDRAAF